MQLIGNFPPIDGRFQVFAPVLAETLTESGGVNCKNRLPGTKHGSDDSLGTGNIAVRISMRSDELLPDRPARKQNFVRLGTSDLVSWKGWPVTLVPCARTPLRASVGSGSPALCTTVDFNIHIHFGFQMTVA